MSFGSRASIVGRVDDRGAVGEMVSRTNQRGPGWPQRAQLDLSVLPFGRTDNHRAADGFLSAKELQNLSQPAQSWA
jgi:hypothetical protein